LQKRAKPATCKKVKVGKLKQKFKSITKHYHSAELAVIILIYWQDAISYELNDEARHSFIHFFRLAHDYGLLYRVPELYFIS
jgi:hypothetical protein